MTVAVMTLSALIASSAYGWERSIHIEWQYTPPSEPAVTGFKLYQEGKEACTFLGGDVREGDCNVSLSQTNTSFTLLATFSDGTTSPHSAPFNFKDSRVIVSRRYKVRVGALR